MNKTKNKRGYRIIVEDKQQETLNKVEAIGKSLKARRGFDHSIVGIVREAVERFYREEVLNHKTA